MTRFIWFKNALYSFVYFKEDDASPLKPQPPRPKDSAFHITRDSVNTKLNNVIEVDPSSVGSDDFQEFESYQSQQTHKTGVPHSGTSDSISEGQFKGTPSMTSSGYGSQAVSTLTLSSEDSLSLRSNDDSEVTKVRRSGTEHTSGGESDGDELIQVQGVITASKSDTISLVSDDSQKTMGVDTETSESTDSLNIDPKKQMFIGNTSYTCEKFEGKMEGNAIIVDNDIKLNIIQDDDKELKNTELDSLKVSDVSKDIENISLSTDSDDENIEPPESLVLHISEEDLRENGERDKTKPKLESVDTSIGDAEFKMSVCDTGSKTDKNNDTDTSLPKHSESLNKDERTVDTADLIRVAANDRDDNSYRNAAGDGDHYSDTSSMGPHPEQANTSSLKSDVFNPSEVVEVKNGDNSSNVSQSLNMDSLGAASDSSSVGSRGVLGSDSVDPYSLEAMDELERLGAECGEDNSEFMSMDEKLENSSVSQGNKSLNRTGNDGLNNSMGGYDKGFPRNQSTPKGTKGSHRLSMPVFSALSPKDPDEGSFHRYSGDYSDNVSGKARTFLLVDLQGFFFRSRLWGGGGMKK